ncbi:hypothetical protein JKP88DRAFT_303967, partial [Tribonema minus]
GSSQSCQARAAHSTGGTSTAVDPNVADSPVGRSRSHHLHSPDYRGTGRDAQISVRLAAAPSLRSRNGPAPQHLRRHAGVLSDASTGKALAVADVPRHARHHRPRARLRAEGRRQRARRRRGGAGAGARGGAVPDTAPGGGPGAARRGVCGARQRAHARAGAVGQRAGADGEAQDPRARLERHRQGRRAAVHRRRARAAPLRHLHLPGRGARAVRGGAAAQRRRGRARQHVCGARVDPARREQPTRAESGAAEGRLARAVARPARVRCALPRPRQGRARGAPVCDGPRESAREPVPRRRRRRRAAAHDGGGVAAAEGCGQGGAGDAVTGACGLAVALCRAAAAAAVLSLFPRLCGDTVVCVSLCQFDTPHTSTVISSLVLMTDMA